MPRVRVEVNRKAVRDLLGSKEVADDLERRAEQIARSAGPGFRVEVERNRGRARAAVITDTIDAQLAEATDRSLTRAIDAGRG